MHVISIVSLSDSHRAALYCYSLISPYERQNYCPVYDAYSGVLSRINMF